MNLKPLAITCGEPSGIGPDICLSLSERDLPRPVVILGDETLLRERAHLLGKPCLPAYDEHQPQAVSVWHIPLRAPVRAGCLNAGNAAYVLQLLDTAYHGIVAGQFAGMVTAPIHKGIINDAALPLPAPFSGHTEYLAHLSGTPQVVMMLAGGGLRVALATTHLPLRQVAAALNRELLQEVIRITLHDLQHHFGIGKPRLLVCGLNPHAGEGGHLGREEIDLITPVITEMQQAGWAVAGPFPADTVFQPFMLKQGDAVLAMYHDQGLPVLKYASFGHGVNITLGLPFIRTSVDHGTALDLAGTGRADAGSLDAAIQTAHEMALAREQKSSV
ncbi:MAG: 4-hydroxythreonine-4-phosphate dehydrogenase PdxA [Neisseria sp.]|nr:4-hydroxythreonine-4-phosphate dehydrogenase PdxA [Neisseria sp.]